MVASVKAREVNKYIGEVWDEFSRLTDEQAIRQINAHHNAYKRYMISKDDCWLYAKSITPNGYGTINNQFVHRIMYENFVGKIPKNLQIDHLCEVKRCINPSHLEVVTRLENMRRYRAKFNGKCNKGHEMAGDNLQVYVYKGKEQKRCRQCANDYQREQKRRSRAKL